MSAKRSQQVNSSHNVVCGSMIDHIALLLKKIKSGSASLKEFEVCRGLTNKLQVMIDEFTDIDQFDRWVAKETIEMSRYTCDKYGTDLKNDRI